ncbi:MAG: nucleotidyltransferase family protein [Bacilli bacterium]
MDVRIIENRDRILETAARFGAHNVRIFGSQLRNEETQHSDLDLLVEFEHPDLLDQIALKQDLEDALGIPVDILTDDAIHPLLKNRILREARSL